MKLASSVRRSFELAKAECTRPCLRTYKAKAADCFQYRRNLSRIGFVCVGQLRHVSPDDVYVVACVNSAVP